jgi:hypothetical protein
MRLHHHGIRKKLPVNISNGAVVVPIALAVILLALIATPFVWSPTPWQMHDVFVRIGNMTAARWDPLTVELPNGQVLVAGGVGNNPAATQIGDSPGLASAELFDPNSGTFRPTGSMSAPRDGAIAALLPDGRVLVAGGAPDRNGSGPVASAEVYDPMAGEFSSTGSMSQARAWAVSATLNDGRVLVVGGDGGSGDKVLDTAEIYDPATSRFSATGSVPRGWRFSTATTLLDGRVLLAGGWDRDGSDRVAFADLYDPKTGTFSETGSMLDARDSPATRLPDGKVLIAGGCGVGPDYPIPLASAELFDPASGSFSRTGSMHLATCSAEATALANGSVLVMADDSVEIYDPAIGTFHPANDRLWSDGAGVILLADGRVLIVGGWSEDDYAPALTSAWLYLP